MIASAANLQVFRN